VLTSRLRELPLQAWAQEIQFLVQGQLPFGVFC